MRLVIAVLALSLAFSQPAEVTWSGARAGPAPVGLTVIDLDVRDAPEGQWRALLWRPIETTAASLTVGAFARLVCPLSPEVLRCLPGLAQGPGALTPAHAERLAAQPLHATDGGTPARASRSLIILFGSLTGLGAEQLSVAEVLASHGYVVAAPVRPTTPTPPTFSLASATSTQRAMQALILKLQSTDATIDRIGLVAWSFGGVPAALEAMTNGAVGAVVSLDSAIRYQYGVELIRSSPDYAPGAFQGALLAVSAGINNSVAKDESVVNAWTRARIERVVAEDLSHADFSDVYGALRSLAGARADGSSFLARYGTIVDRTVAFFGRAFRPVATGQVRGRVFDEYGASIPHASISFQPWDPGADLTTFSAVTDVRGRFDFGGVRPGRYRVTGTALGYATTVMKQEVVDGVETEVTLVVRR